MAFLFVTELKSPLNAPGVVAPVCPLPPEVEQRIAIGAAVLSAPFGAQTRMIRVAGDAVCSIAIGPGMTTAGVSTSNMRIAANAPGEYFAVKPADIMAVISNT